MIKPYEYSSREVSQSDEYVYPRILKIINNLYKAEFKLLDFGCGSGGLEEYLASHGVCFSGSGYDPSVSGIQFARLRSFGREFMFSTSLDSFRESEYDLIVCAEVLEHLYDPMAAVREMRKLISISGFVVVSVPYHSFLKNLSIICSGRFDEHFCNLQAGEHIKFFSLNQLTRLFRLADFELVDTTCVGRIWPVYKSMICVFKPA